MFLFRDIFHSSSNLFSFPSGKALNSSFIFLCLSLSHENFLVIIIIVVVIVIKKLSTVAPD